MRGPKEKIIVGEGQDTAHQTKPKNLGGHQIRTKIQTRSELNTRATSQENRPDLAKPRIGKTEQHVQGVKIDFSIAI
jgi:hypothetical protein